MEPKLNIVMLIRQIITIYDHVFRVLMDVPPDQQETFFRVIMLMTKMCYID